MNWWRGNPDLEDFFDNMSGPGQFHALERLFWLEMWRTPVLDAIEEDRIESRRYGPVLGFANPVEPRISMFNLLLGADRTGAVAGGHLDEALDWTESLGLALRVPLRDEAEFGEPDEAEELLTARGYRRHTALATFARGLPAAPLPTPPGIEVELLEGDEMAETFSIVLSPSYGLEWTGESFLISLPGRRDWRTYIARDAETKWPLGAAATMMHYERPQLAFAGTIPEHRGKGVHTALLNRQLQDAATTRGVSQAFAITEELPNFPQETTPAARNLARAGFQLMEARSVWRPPEELITPIDAEPDFGDSPI